jgi:hypothetical protein
MDVSLAYLLRKALFVRIDTIDTSDLFSWNTELPVSLRATPPGGPMSFRKRP